MATTLALQFLTVVLFFFMIGQGINARDLKVELQDHNQVDSNDKPYITQYRVTKPNYPASYTTKKHNKHISHLEKLTEPYITGYGTNTEVHKVSQPNYITGYLTHTHESNGPYITNYGNHEAKQSESNGPYITSYGKHEAKNPDYTTGYKTNNHESNGPYITAYGRHEAKQPDFNGPYITEYGKHEAKHPDYITGYKTHTHESNGPYIAAYGKHDAKQLDSNGPYITQYGTHEAKNPDYTTGYKTHTHEANGPYITTYGRHEAKQMDSNGPYITQYGKHEAKNPNYITGYKTHTHESNEPYISTYGKHETKQLESNGPYITQYGKHEAKQQESNGPYTTSYGKQEAKQQNYNTRYRTHTHESNELYVTSYGNHEAKQPDYLIRDISTGNDPKGPPSTNLKDLNDLLSPNLDRTEAFKVGFFNLDDLYVENVMTLQFPVQEVSPFLLKKEADSIPLTMSQLPSVLQLFSIPEDSPQANSMIASLGECEAETITGETKTCANSLESMLEFVDTIIGSDTKHSILTTNKPSLTAIPLQNYTILEVSHDIDAPKWVACHPLSYPYAIYFCHYIATGTRVFKVSLVGDANEDKMEAVGICHLDTSDWNPDHIIFRQLRVKAGKNSPVCHFLPVNHLLWVPMQPSKATM